MSPRLDGAREASLSRWLALTPFILQKSRMRRRARTDLCGGRSAMGVPTATITERNLRLADHPSGMLRCSFSELNEDCPVGNS